MPTGGGEGGLQVLWPGIVGQEGARSAGDAPASALQGSLIREPGGDWSPGMSTNYSTLFLCTLNYFLKIFYLFIGERECAGVGRQNRSRVPDEQRVRSQDPET